MTEKVQAITAKWQIYERNLAITRKLCLIIAKAESIMIVFCLIFDISLAAEIETLKFDSRKSIWKIKSHRPINNNKATNVSQKHCNFLWMIRKDGLRISISKLLINVLARVVCEVPIMEVEN